MTCGFSLERVHAFVDGELAVEAALDAERHVLSCPSCAAEMRRARALGDALRGGGLAAAPPDTLESRIRLAIARDARASRRRAPGWLAVAAALVLGAALGFLAGPGRAPSAAGDAALVAAHARALAEGPLVQVEASDRHVVKPWFADKIDFSPKVRDFGAEGFPLAGGRIDRVAGRKVAVLTYRHGRHVVDLFVEPASAPSPDVSVRRVRGLLVAAWTEGDLSYAAVSDMEERELLAFADHVRR